MVLGKARSVISEYKKTFQKKRAAPKRKAPPEERRRDFQLNENPLTIFNKPKFRVKVGKKGPAVETVGHIKKEINPFAP
jgi:hypothetical protein